MGLTVFKLGWEFPPNSFGGLGVACEGLVKGLIAKGMRIILVLPRHVESPHDACRIITADIGNLSKREVDSLLAPYQTSQSYRVHAQKHGTKPLYGEDIFQEVARYTECAVALADKEHFDVIHAHDWMSFQAAVRIKKRMRKPMVVHVHATEFDRTGGLSVHQYVYDIERAGMHAADRVIAVSGFTKQKIVKHYGIHPDKVSVVHNGINPTQQVAHQFRKTGPLVLFLGRLTLQKGPDYFIQAAHKVLERRTDVTFVVAGSGDMEYRLIEQAAYLGIADKVLFTGYLGRDEVQRMYRMADVYVMPSVSEPFGLTPLESLQQGTPVIISKQSGVSEKLAHCLKIDFWDINEMTSKICAVLEYPELHRELTGNGQAELGKFCWHRAAQTCIETYKRVCE